MKNYSEDEVHALIRTTISCCVAGFQGWLESDDITIVNTETKKNMKGQCELSLIENPKTALENYIYPLLAKKGIKITNKK